MILWEPYRTYLHRGPTENQDCVRSKNITPLCQIVGDLEKNDVTVICDIRNYGILK